jgi:DNA-3-methyladenine glycosylase II
MTASDPTPQVFSEADVPALCDTLASRDDRLRHVIEEFGYPPFWSRPNTFESVVWFVLEQQVSLASAKAALEKLRQRAGLVTPENVLALSDDDLRAASFSRQKIAYVRGLAQRIADGTLDLTALETLPDEEVRERLVRLKGVGNWTVDVYSILVLHRADLFPAGDLAAVNGLKELSGLPRATPAGDLTATVRPWAPYRTIGTLLVWHYYLSRRRAPRASA